MEIDVEEQLITTWFRIVIGEKLVERAQIVVYIRVREAQERNTEAMEELFLKAIEV